MKIITCNCMLRTGLKRFFSQGHTCLHSKFNDAVIVEIASLEEIPILLSFLKIFEAHKNYVDMTLIIATNQKSVMSIKNFKGSVISLGLGVEKLYEKLNSCKFTPMKLSLVYSLLNDSCHIRLLTPKEEELLYCILLGFTLNEIARAMDIKTKTVYGHLNHLKEKLGQPSVARMTVFIKRYYRWFKTSYLECNHPLTSENSSEHKSILK